MHLSVTALIGSIGVTVFCVLLWFVAGVRRSPRELAFAGTLILLGCVLFELLPEIMELGVVFSLFLVVLSWAAFTALHKITGCGNADGNCCDSEEQRRRRSNSVTLLVGSMALQCFAGGFMLVGSSTVSERLALGVFWGLLLHKAFETLSVLTLLADRSRSRFHFATCFLIYFFSLPAGVFVAEWGETLFAKSASAESLEQGATIAVVLASGSLLCCLLQDFLIPSFRDLRNATFRVREPG